jgi:hypothetical protein
MKETIIAALSKYFSAKFREKLKRSESLAALLAKLEKKEVKLKAKLEKQLEQDQRELVEAQLKVLVAQKKKAEQIIQSEQDD